MASPLPVVALMIAGGGAAGWIVVRTGSLAIPIALHVAVDIPLYYGNACLSSRAATRHRAARMPDGDGAALS